MNREQSVLERRRNRVSSLLLDLLYPPRCPFCEEALPVGERVHRTCAEAVPRIRGSRCICCGKPVGEGERLCGDCSENRHSFDAGFGAFVYDGTVRDALLALKFRGKKEYADALGQMTAKEAEPFLKKWNVEMLLPVPMHPAKQRKRGFNQAEALAVSIGRCISLPVVRNVLVRTRGTEAMKALEAEDRKRNLRSAFRVNHAEKIRGKNICLIDDIYTTGATADACAEACSAAGASRVVFVTTGIGDDR